MHYPQTHKNPQKPTNSVRNTRKLTNLCKCIWWEEIPHLPRWGVGLTFAVSSKCATPGWWLSYDLREKIVHHVALNGLKEAQILIDEDKTYSGMKVISARVCDNNTWSSWNMAHKCLWAKKAVCIRSWVPWVIDCLALLCVVMANGRFCGQLVNPLFRKLQASELWWSQQVRIRSSSNQPPKSLGQSIM